MKNLTALAAIVFCLMTVQADAAAKQPAQKSAQKSEQSAQKSDQGVPEQPRAYPSSRFAARNFVVLAPAVVEEGGLMLVRLESSLPSLTLRWRDKKHSVTLHNGHGVALLPAPLETKNAQSRALTLDVVSSTDKKDALKIPVAVRPVNWAVQRISVEPKYVNPPQEVTARIAADRERTKAALATVRAERFWGTPFVRPVPGTVSSAFGGKRVFNNEPRSRHKGVDLRGAMGTPIVAAAAGRVILAEEQYYSGNVVYVDHGQGLVTVYCHMSAMHVTPGQTVQPGETLGLVGATGRVTGPHLHLSTLLYGESINPLALFSLK